MSVLLLQVRLLSISQSKRCISDDLTLSLVNPLQARTFAIWTLTASIVRFYCAYHIHEKSCVNFSRMRRALAHTFVISVYDITMFTYLIAFGHFFSEFVIFKSTKLNGPFISPVIVSSSSSKHFPSRNLTSYIRVFSHLVDMDVFAVRLLRQVLVQYIYSTNI